jgi:sarcosine oxidase subunit beta
MAGFKLPITHPAASCVSVPLKPFLDQIVVSGSLHIYISQSARGELVMGGSSDPYGVYSTRRPWISRKG